MKHILIVNADDCNLTPGVTHAILDSHDHGILTSTTFMANLPIQKETLRQILKRKNLGVGIHLNVTFGKPVSRPSRIKSLLTPDGFFRKVQPQVSRPPEAGDLAAEYQAQIDHFTVAFGRNPTHLDTHHQVHDDLFFLKVLAQVAKKNGLPVRRSKSMRVVPGLRTPDFFFGNLSPAGYWTPGPLETILKNLPPGVSEIMCHPGRHDRELEAVSSFRKGRQKEWRLFRSSRLRKFVLDSGIVLSHYGLCYT